MSRASTIREIGTGHVWAVRVVDDVECVRTNVDRAGTFRYLAEDVLHQMLHVCIVVVVLVLQGRCMCLWTQRLEQGHGAVANKQAVLTW